MVTVDDDHLALQHRELVAQAKTSARSLVSDRLRTIRISSVKATTT